LKLYTICARNNVTLVEAEDKDHAFAKYFQDILENKVSLEKLGNIIVLNDHGKEYPFRTVPLLWQMGVIDDDAAIENIKNVLGIESTEEARVVLMLCAKRDARLIPMIKSKNDRDPQCLKERGKES